MRFFLLSVAALAPMALAGIMTRQSNPPACLNTCLGMLPLNLTTCDPTDFTCLCGSSSFLNAVTQCIDAQCDTADIESAEQWAVSTCAAAGVQVTPAPIPGTASGSGATSSPASTGSPSSASSSPSASPSASASSGVPLLNPASTVLLAGLATAAGLLLSL